jgi:plasmid stabilization system protein ParE
MAHRVSAKAEQDLDAIWIYVASQTDDVDRADRLIETITDRFYLLSEHPFIGRHRPDRRSNLRSFLPARISSSIA